MMDYPYSKFDDCSFDRFGSTVWTNRRTHRQTQMKLPVTLWRAT